MGCSLSQEKSSILKELGMSVEQMAGNKKIMAFCKSLKLAKYFVRKPFFAFSKIANYQSCSQDLIESIPQFQSWVSQDVEADCKLFTRVIYKCN